MPNLLDHLFGGGTPQGLLTPDGIERARRQGLLNAGLGMLAASQNNGFGKSLAMGVQAGQEAYSGAAQNNVAQQEYAKEQAAMEKRRQILSRLDLSNVTSPAEAGIRLRALATQLLRENDLEGVKVVQELAKSMGTEGTSYSAPVQAMGPDGKPMFVRPGSDGSMLPVEGYSPVMETYTVDLGDRVEVRERGTNRLVDTLQPGQKPGALTAGEQALRREYTPLAEPYQIRVMAYNQLQALAKNTPSGANDLAIVVSYAKLLDPGSVVREGEVEVIRNTGGLPNWLVAQYNKLQDGGLMSEKQRQNILTASRTTVAAVRERGQTLFNRYRKIAEAAGYEPSRVVFNPLDGFTGEEAPAPPPGSWSDALGGVR